MATGRTDVVIKFEQKIWDTAPDFPRELQNIFEGLGVPENSVSLWLNAVLVQSLALELLLNENQIKFDRQITNEDSMRAAVTQIRRSRSS